MEWLIDLLQSGVQEILATVLLAALSLASAYAVAWIRMQEKRLNSQLGFEVRQQAISRAADLAANTVLALNGEARKLKEAKQPGQLKELGLKAVNDVLRHLGDEGRKALEATVGDARDFVEDLVEAQVENLKTGLGKGASSNPPAGTGSTATG